MASIEKFQFLKVGGKEIEGILTKIEPSYETRYLYEISFPYALEYINQIREGRFLAVKNFATKGPETHWSILEVAYIEPFHYALHNITHSHYPQFVEVAAKNASLDWTEQVDSPEIPTTRIVVRAIPTNLEIVERVTRKYILQEESNIPMLGKEVYVLDNETTEQIINKGMNKGYINAGTWTIGKEVKIRVNVEELLRKHFGIFGFTGAGKSNLLSTLLRKIMEYSSQENEPIKLVVWDLMSEYYGLLLDVLCKYDGYLIAIGEKTFPDSVLDYLKTQDSSKLDQAAEDLVKTMVFPKEIKNNEIIFPSAIIEVSKKLLSCGKIVLLSEQLTVDRVVKMHPPWKGLRSQDKIETIKGIVGRVFGRYKDTNTLLTPGLATELLQALEQELESVGDDIKRKFIGIINELRNAQHMSTLGMTLDKLISLLNSPETASLIIMISHDPHKIREYSEYIGTTLYETRRKQGILTPIVTFIFDEADEFIPHDIDKRHDSYRKSSEIAMTIARRGRKFGLGLGIATQRIRYLNTSILAQPHTYFVSKLPRKTDREAVAEAFGLGLDMFNQTFKFRKGDWLVISHDALGMEAVPIPVHFENANTKVIEFLNNLPEHCCDRTEATD